MGISTKKLIGKQGRLMARLDYQMKKEEASRKKLYAKKSKKQDKED